MRRLLLRCLPVVFLLLLPRAGRGRAGRSDDSPRAFLVLGLLSFLHGIFHAAGPGHGKVVVSGYVLASERQGPGPEDRLADRPGGKRRPVAGNPRGAAADPVRVRDARGEPWRLLRIPHFV